MNRLSLLLSAFLFLMLCPASRAVERVRMHCDRSLYAAGETVWERYHADKTFIDNAR